MNSTELVSRRWTYERGPARALPSWRGVLTGPRPAVVAAAVDLEAVRCLVEGFSGSLLTDMAESVRAWWPLRPRFAWGFELVVVHPDGTREKHQIHHRVLRIGRDPSCQLQLRSEVVSGEHCEIRVDDGALWLVDLASSNGTKVDESRVTAWEPRALDSGSRIEAGPFRLVVGQVRSRFAEPGVSVRFVGLESVDGAFPLERLGTPDSPWVEVAVAPAAGGWRGWLRLPTTWLRAARGAVAEAPPVAPTAAFDTPLDYAITAFLLSRVATTFESRSGIAVTLSTPRPQREMLLDPPAGERFVVARYEVVVGDAAWLVDAVWAPVIAPLSKRSAAGFLGELPMSVAVVVGAIDLAPADLAGVDRGDILVPDRWYPEHWAEDAPPADLGAVELRVQSWSATGRLRFEKGFFHLGTSSAWTIRPQGETMPPTDSERRDDTAEHDLATADPTRLVDELEVTVAFELERVPVPLRDLAEWREGGVVRLDRRPEDPIRLVLHHGGRSRLLGYGRVVVVDDRLGVQIDRWLGEHTP